MKASCVECGGGFRSSAAHMMKHIGSKLLTCAECRMKFADVTALRVHHRVHTGERPYECNECGKTFARESNLKRHMNVHYGVKMFSCAQCGNKFSEKGHLQRHMLAHSGRRDVKCNECFSDFPTRISLKAHMRRHTGEIYQKKFGCTDCSHSFTTTYNQRRHREAVHNKDGKEIQSKTIPETSQTPQDTGL